MYTLELQQLPLCLNDSTSPVAAASGSGGVK